MLAELLVGRFRSHIDHTDERQMATIRLMKGKWQVLIRKKLAKHIVKSFTYKADAEKYARETEAKIDQGIMASYDEAGRTTLSELLERYRLEITTKKKSSEVEDYKIKLLQRLDIAQHTLLRITPTKIAKLRDYLLADRSPASVNKYLSYLSNAFNIARKEWGINLPDNPVAMIRKPTVKNRRERVLTPAEYARLLDAASQSKIYNMKALVIFAYTTAARFGEIVKLERCDVSFSKRTALFRDTKNDDDREVPLTEDAINILKEQPVNTDGKMFRSITHDQFKHYWNRVRRDAQLTDFRFHDLRACAITNFMLPPYNFTIPQVAVISGHKSWKELERYERIKPAQIVDQFIKLQK